jgi:ribonuclease T1
LLLVLVGLLLVVAACSGAGSTPKPSAVFDQVVGQDVAIPDGWSGQTIRLDELPAEALETLALIADGGPYPYRQDDGVFQNREGILPDRPLGTYREYTVETPRSPDRGARRLVVGDGREVYYTDDHYASFRFVTP